MAKTVVERGLGVIRKGVHGRSEMALNYGQPSGGSKEATAADLVQAVKRVAAAIAALPLIAAKAKNDSRLSAYEAADLVRELQDKLSSD